jgi:hypothetical protein
MKKGESRKKRTTSMMETNNDEHENISTTLESKNLGVETMKKAGLVTNEVSLDPDLDLHDR